MQTLHLNILEHLGITVESYQLGLDAANKTVDHQPAHVPSHLLSSIEHLGESQLKLIISKAFEKIADQKNLLIELATKSPVVKLLGSVTEEFYRHLADVKRIFFSILSSSNVPMTMASTPILGTLQQCL